MRFIFIALSSFILSLNCLALGATPEVAIPEKYDFKFSKEERLEISSKNFCWLKAGVSTYNASLRLTNSEVLILVCDGKKMNKGGPIKTILKADERLNEILTGTIGDLVRMKFNVVGCSTAAEKLEVMCYLTKLESTSNK